jgi:hypothetical protein
MKIALKTACVIAGNRHSSGDIVDLPPGVKGPTSTNIRGEETLLYEILDEDIEKERAEIAAKHAKELAEFERAEDRSKERAALAKKHADENTAFRTKAQAKELEKRHAREVAALKAKHARELKAFEAREAMPIDPPAEVIKEDLDKRIAIEDKALADKHSAEKEAAKPEAKTKEPA